MGPPDDASSPATPPLVAPAIGAPTERGSPRRTSARRAGWSR